MSNSKKIVSVIGDIFCDVLVTNFTSIPPWGTDAEAHIIFAAGGSALNTVLHGANFSCLKEKNVCFALYSAVGNDIQGEICLNAIGGKEDILNYIYKSTAYATGTCIVISATSDRLFFF